MSNEERRTSPILVALLAVTSAFCVYFCMYAFRKPFTAARYEDLSLWGLGFKSLLVIAQTLGYTLSKFLGIKWVSELKGAKRAWAIVGLIGAAQLTLLLFALAPLPLKVACMFLNGLPLGMVFGLVASYLEGRAASEILTAGLCASFILAGDIMKSVGSFFLQSLHVDPFWMPFCVGAAFFGPLVCFCWLLTLVPPPSARDVALRSERPPLNRKDRAQFLAKHGLVLALLVIPFVLITSMRSLRDDFAPELWKELSGKEAPPSNYAAVGTLVTLGVLASSGLLVIVSNNLRAFRTGLGVCLLGMLFLAGCLELQNKHLLTPGQFMTFTGLGLYLPYAAMHTTLLERLLAVTRDRGNFGYLMYIADSAGYLGSLAVVLVSNLKLWKTGDGLGILGPFMLLSWATVIASVICYSLCFRWPYSLSVRQAGDK